MGLPKTPPGNQITPTRIRTSNTSAVTFFNLLATKMINVENPPIVIIIGAIPELFHRPIAVRKTARRPIMYTIIMGTFMFSYTSLKRVC